MPTRALIRSIWGLSALLAALAIGAAPALAHAKVHGPKRAFGRGTSTNWSGYAVDGSNATSVAGSWTQPAVSCGINENSWSSPWVGIDGDNSNTVEQIGTDSDCQNGKAVYYAWYEMYPKSLVTIPMTVTAGHTYAGSVTYSPTSGSFTLTLADQTAGTTPYTTTQSSRKARRSSAGCSSADRPPRPATSMSQRPRGRRSTPTAGSTPATSAICARVGFGSRDARRR